MQTYRIVVLILLLGVGQALFAQSKKQLKEQVAQLQVENAELNRETDELERQLQQSRDAYNMALEQNTQLQDQVQQLQQQIADPNRDYQKLNEDYETLKNRTVGITGGTTGTPLPPNTGGVRPCVYYANQLAEGSSYTLDYKLWPGGGWGIQIATFSDLCTAETRAREFAKDYTLYPTYLKMKVVSGKQMYAVIYGAMQDENQARSYLANFKKIAKGPEKNGFLVRH